MTKAQDDEEKRVFEGFLVLNYRNGSVKVRKDVKDNRGYMGPFDIPIKFNITIKIPKVEEHSLQFEDKVIELPKDKVRGMLLESM